MNEVTFAYDSYFTVDIMQTMCSSWVSYSANQLHCTMMLINTLFADMHLLKFDLRDVHSRKKLSAIGWRKAIPAVSGTPH